MNGTTGTAAGDVITDLGHDVYQIDTRMAGYSGIVAGYLILSDRPCLVETGTAPSAPLVIRALAHLGVGPADLATLAVTHIHLDHAGGTGDLAEHFPAAEIVVHEKGARHLADPSRLMASAHMVYGDELDALFGRLAPTPAGRIRAVDDAGRIDQGGGRRQDVGDAAGVYIQETGDMRPATPPPDFDLETALASLRTFKSLRPQRLLFSHFGPVSAVGETLERSAEEIRLWVDETKRAVGSGLSLDHAAAMVQERTRDRYAVLREDGDPLLAAKFERVAGTGPNVAGIMHWLDKTPGAA
jgi:glyoxylase-like metal-dependent hydrolase (beta-lactamase superfamily II)